MNEENKVETSLANLSQAEKLTVGCDCGCKEYQSCVCQDVTMLQTQKTIKLPAKEFARFKRLTARETSSKRERHTLLAQWESNGLLPDKNQENVGEYVISNGNRLPMGKLTLYNVPEKVIRASIARRLS